MIYGRLMNYLCSGNALRSSAIAIVNLLVLVSLAGAASAQDKNVRAVRTDSPIQLDGYLREDAWKTAEPVTDFTQREPQEGSAPTEQTEVRILFDNDALYIGVVCHDSEPDKIVRKELMWDGDLEGDDIFTIVFDTFNDKRSGFYFSTNANGAMHDALIKNLEDTNDDWDGIWDVKARITDTGWTAEMVIPFMTLRFPDNGNHDWGVNFMRSIRRKNEEVLWTAWGRQDGVLQISKAGTLTGLSGIKRGKLTEFKPYFLTGVEKNNGDDIDDTYKYGIDVKYPLTSDLTLDFTTKTDFAQVESDKEKINLTRFNQEYPEKREFFLEGAEIFDATQGSVKLFYSRNIGITPDPDRQAVPILGGVKLSGKSGRYNIGLVSMQTEEETVVTEDGTKNVYPSTNYSAVRIKRDILKQSYIGFIGTSVNRTDKPDNSLTGSPERDRFINRQSNYMGAVDFAYNTSEFMGNKNATVEGYIAGTSTPDLPGGNFAGRLRFDFPNDLIDMYASYHSIGENFNPELGFLSRSGIQEYTTMMKYMPRVKLPYIRKLAFEPLNISYTTDTGSKLLSRTIDYQLFGFVMQSGDTFEFQKHYHYDYLDYDFNVFGKSTIPVGGYTYDHWMVQYQSVKSRAISFDLQSSWGGYYNGTRSFYVAACTYKVNRFLSLTPDLSYYDIDLKHDSFIARNTSMKIQTNLSTRLFSSAFVQWNNRNHDLNMNFRIHWIPKIGSDLFIAYNQLWDEEDDMRTLYNAGIVKVDYMVRF